MLCPGSLGLACALAAAASPLLRPYTIENYSATIAIDPAPRLNGDAFLTIRSHVETPISALELDTGSLSVERVLAGSEAQYFERKSNLLVIALTRALQPGASVTLEIRYQAQASAGLTFTSDNVIATNASDWLPCNDRPGERSTLHLTIQAPVGWKVAASRWPSRTSTG